VSEDPLGFAAGDMNSYRYVGNSPLDYTDPSGMSSFSGVLGAVGSALGTAVTSTATSMASGYASAGAYIGGVGAAAIDYSLGTNLVSLGSPTASLPGGGQLVVTGYGGPTPFQQGASAFHTTAAGMSSFSHPASSTQTAATYSPVYAVPTYADAMGLSDADYYRTKLQGAINSNDIAAIDKYSFALANATGADYVDIRMNAEDPNVATQIALAVGKTPDLIVNGPQEAVAWGLTFGGDNQMLVTTVTEAMKANDPDRYWQNYEMVNDGAGSSRFYDPALDPNRIVMEPIVTTATDPYMWAGASWMVSGTGPSAANLLDDAAGTAWKNSTRAVTTTAPSAFPSPTIGSKIQSQMGRRSWTAQQIDQAVQGGMQIPAINKATGNPATRFVHPTTGQSVVVDRVTGEVIHVGGPGFQYGPGAGDVPLLPPPGR